MLQLPEHEIHEASASWTFILMRHHTDQSLEASTDLGLYSGYAGVRADPFEKGGVRAEVGRTGSRDQARATTRAF